MAGKPFLWLEPDSIPTRAGWLAAIAADYKRQGAEILISSDTHPPHDIVGGIGVYGPDVRWLIPKRIARGGFDGWMVRHLGPLIAKTPLIQHSYGVYDSRGEMTRRHSFPGDAGMLRPDAMIFHADPSQSLIVRPKNAGEKTFCHTGDLGDVIAALPVIRQMGGGRLVMRDHPYCKDGQYRPIKGVKFQALRPLLEAQDYIESVEYDETCPVDIDFTHFRKHYSEQNTLTAAHAAHVRCADVDLSPWLHVEPSATSAGRVIVARSERYHNDAFPWKRLAHQLRKKILFVGLREEHAAFQREAKCQVEYHPTADLLELAGLIAGSEFFIGNQSSPCWIAMALGHPLIQETSTWNPDSRIPRENAKYCLDGDVKIP